MKILILTFCFWLLSIIGLSQEPAKSINSEAITAIEFLQQLPEYDRPYIKLFTTYDMSEHMREDAVLALSFVCHSLAGLGKTDLDNTANYSPLATVDENGKFIPIQNVPNSSTLWYVDIRNYNWTIESFEKIAVLSPYEAEPIIEHKYAAALRSLSGNCILRASWFIVHSTDVMRQADIGEQSKIYYELLYSKTGIPKTGVEFKTIWGLDEEKVKNYAGDSGAISIDSQVVARHNRILRQFPTLLGGYLYESIDVANEEDFRDYLESLPESKGENPVNRDAGELIASNQFHMQTYALVNGNDQVIDFADGAIARHPNDVLSDNRVRVGVSCMDCHSNGLIPVRNVAAEYKDFLNIQTPKYEYKARIERIFQTEKFNEQAVRDSELFKEALLKINGLNPEENAANFLDIIRWYSSPLDIRQVCRELGTTEEILREKTAKSFEVFGVDRVPGRLKLALHKEKPIDIVRTVWESNSKKRPGLFQQAHIILHGLTTISTEYVERPLPKDDERVILEVEVDDSNVVVAPRDIEAKVGSKVIYTYKKGERIDLTGSNQVFQGETWLGVKDKSGNTANIRKKDLE